MGEMWGNNPFSGSVAIPETSAMYSDPLGHPQPHYHLHRSLVCGCHCCHLMQQMILLLVGICCSFILPFFYVP